MKAFTILLITLAVVVALVAARAPRRNLLQAPTCGTIGAACCYTDNALSCAEGSCLTYPSKAGGVCSNFGGIFVAKDEATCAAANFWADPLVNGGCACASGFEATTLSVSTAGGPVNLSVCQSTAEFAGLNSDKYGGVYATTGEGSCAGVNRYTGDCTCPAEYTEVQTFPVDSSVPNLRVNFCLRSAGLQTPSFAGAFATSQDGSCAIPNVLTDSCSCGAVATDSYSGACAYDFKGLTNVGAPVTVTGCHVVPTDAAAAIGLTADGVSTLLQAAASNASLFDLPIAIENEITGTQQVSVPLLGQLSMQYFLTNLQITDLTLGIVNTTLDADLMNLIVNFNLVRMTGKFRMTSASVGETRWDLRISFQMQMTTTVNAEAPIHGGRLFPQFAASDLQAVIVGPVNVELLNGAGGLAFAENFVRDAIVQQLSAQLTSQIASFGSVIDSLLAEANQYLPTLPNVIGIDDSVFLDFGFIGCKANITSAGIYMPLAGKFVVLGSPLPAIAIPEVPSLSELTSTLQPDVNRLLGFTFTTEFLRSLGNALQKGSGVQTVNDLPLANGTDTLNVAYMKPFIPGLETYATDDTPMRMQLSLAQLPEMGITDHSVTASLQFDVGFDIVVASPDGLPASVTCIQVPDSRFACRVAQLSLNAQLEGALSILAGPSVLAQVNVTQLTASNIVNNVGSEITAESLSDIISSLGVSLQEMTNALLARNPLAIPIPENFPIIIEQSNIVYLANRAVIVQIDFLGSNVPITA